jgi:3-phenylpropionate/trans-cinnamate dioxygenase ferredoxin component
MKGVRVAQFVTVGKADEVPEGEARSFDVGGKAVAVARVNGSWFAFDDTCTHRHCSLSEGEIWEDAIACPCHGSEFALATGEVMNGPATEPVQSYEVRVEGDELQVSK